MKDLAVGRDLHIAEGATYSALYDFETKDIYRINKQLSHDLICSINNPKLREEVWEYFMTEYPEIADRLFNNISPIESKKPQLDFVWFEITSDKCNLKCKHCYAESSPVYKQSPNVLSHDEWLAMINDCYILGARSCQFIGGEPLVYKEQGHDVNELIHYAYTIGYDHIELFTNATLIQKLDLTLAAKALTVAKVSLHSSVEEVHDKITQVKGSYKQCVSGIKELMAHNIDVAVHIVVQKENEHTLDETIKFCDELGIKNVRHEPVRLFGRANATENEATTEYRIGSFKDRPNFFANKDYICNWLSSNPCLSGKLTITSHGNVLVCPFNRDRVHGNVREQSLKTITQQVSITDLWELTKSKVAICCDCEYRLACFDCRILAANEYDATINVAKVPPARCSYDPYQGEWRKGYMWAMDTTWMYRMERIK